MKTLIDLWKELDAQHNKKVENVQDHLNCILDCFEVDYKVRALLKTSILILDECKLHGDYK